VECKGSENNYPGGPLREGENQILATHTNITADFKQGFISVVVKHPPGKSKYDEDVPTLVIEIVNISEF
jgi:hypothetical protein